jgi:competence protein ComEC
MVRWIPYTFVRIALFFIGGILLGVYLPDIIPEAVAKGLFVTLVIFYLVAYGVTMYLKKSFFNLGIIGLPAVFLAGYVHLLSQTDARYQNHILAEENPISNYRVVITRYAEEKERSWKTEAKVLEVLTDTWHAVDGKIILYFSKDAFQTPYLYGDVLLIKGAPSRVSAPANPGEFDYRRFLTFRNIYHQHFLRKNDVRLTGHHPPSKIIDYAIQARNRADKTLKKFVQGEREQAIASALVLGVTDGLDNELLNAYAATGAMHVLAVSGLHITIIYMILLWLLKPLLKLKSGQWIVALISLFVLWGYAFVTGLSPSVLRAVTMFSFIALARPAGQSTNIYNTLAASAFCLLMFDPFLIMSVGFQLSYLAVLGIVYLQNPLYGLWETDNYLLDKIWEITCISIAAQVATFSLGLLYFHQFPNYFLLSNLLVIPGSFLVLIAGIAVLVFSFITSVAALLGVALTWLIKALNFVVFVVEGFPYSLVENIYINVAQSWLLMAVIISFILLFEFRKFVYSLWATTFVVSFAFFQWQHFSDDINLKKITIYDVRGHSAMDLIDRGHAYFMTDSILLKNEDRIRFHIRPNRLISGVAKIEVNTPSFRQEIAGGEILRWNQQTILKISERNFDFPGHLHFDCIVVGNNVAIDLNLIKTTSPDANIILDSSNSFFYSARVVAEAKKQNLKVHSVLHQGAFEYYI